MDTQSRSIRHNTDLTTGMGPKEQKPHSQLTRYRFDESPPVDSSVLRPFSQAAHNRTSTTFISHLHITVLKQNKQKRKMGKRCMSNYADIVLSCKPPHAFCAALVVAEHWLFTNVWPFLRCCSLALTVVLSGYCFAGGNGGEAINLLLSCLQEGGVHSRTGSHTLVH